MNADGSYDWTPGTAYEPLSPDWSFDSEAQSPTGCSARRLPNGNTLIADNTGAEMWEIDSMDSLVWFYISPVSFTGPVEQGYPTTNAQGQNTHSTFRIERYPLDFEGFIDQDMTPGPPVELEPWDYDCQTLQDTITEPIDSSTFIIDREVIESVSLYPNPVHEILHIDSDRHFDSYTIYSAEMRLISSGPFRQMIHTEHIRSGIYYLELRSEDYSDFSVFVKE